MNLYFKYNEELGIPDLKIIGNDERNGKVDTSTEVNSKAANSMTIFLECKEGKSRNRKASLHDTFLTMLHATRGVYNQFVSDIAQIEMTNISGIEPISSPNTMDSSNKGNNSQGRDPLFNSKYRVCNWRVSKENIDEFTYLTAKDEEAAKVGVIKYRPTFFESFQSKSAIEEYEKMGIPFSATLENANPERFRAALEIISSSLSLFKLADDTLFETSTKKSVKRFGKKASSDIGLRIIIDKNTGKFEYAYFGKRIRSIDDASDIITNKDVFTLFLFLNLMIEGYITTDRFDIIYIDAEGIDKSILMLMRIIAQALKSDTNWLEQNALLIFYNVNDDFLQYIKEKDNTCQVIEIPNIKEHKIKSIEDKNRSKIGN